MKIERKKEKYKQTFKTAEKEKFKKDIEKHPNICSNHKKEKDRNNK